MRWLWAIAVLSVALGLAACGNDNADDDGASRAAEEIFRAFLEGDYGRTWDSLHPTHQMIVARDTFINCQVGRSIPWTRVEVFREHDEIWEAPDVGQVTTRAVELRLIGNQDISQGTLHMIQVDGQWRWFLDEDAVRAFKQGRCA